MIGRLAAADIPIPDEYESVSLRHAQVDADQRGIWLRDLGSMAGTSVNCVPLSTRHEVQIRLGDRIRLGWLEIEVVHDFATKGRALSGKVDGCENAENVGGSCRPGAAELSRLTNAEHELVMWMARGYTQPEELGTIFFRSPHTVRTQMKSVFQKLGVHSRAELLSWLRRIALSEMHATSATAAD